MNNKRKNYRFILIFIITLTVVVFPYIADASITIPCGRIVNETTGKVEMCGFNDIFELINSTIKFFLTMVLLPIVILLISYSGFLFMTSAGNEEKRTKAKSIFKHVILGILMILGAWFIVYTVFRAFGYDTSRGRAGLSDGKIEWNSGK
ncbi:hypothetical protein A3C57_02150 [Candidatus Nomurabacteria bacterium RIFCSPHIGHO2_02_FULL_33_12]|uniref:Uncharacterized protein n=1 Tax=Candidatus Nomurabacteria bacterium RIFCSPLOWO2_01_FULL_33_17 TaxID=1801764 RepID=A0A1F6WPB3_9BACT|nr:MAG: hypothetical protein A3C57_02150 [Candidatus Nomurabacteria bacterium RIFCSPHIGHO2_02_FULL_33_12]OGI83697.1 MAG: hypothetical protein A2903_01420 [Candidatus Nomurabacteria bacterium RIFCSPLOWO2_01_FULL_33_17]